MLGDLVTGVCSLEKFGLMSRPTERSAERLTERHVLVWRMRCLDIYVNTKMMELIGWMFLYGSFLLASLGGV
jgi:hypothetical protein